MIQTLFITLLLLVNLYARENPFFPSDAKKEIPITSNEDMSVPPLKRVAITLPSQARIIQKVTIEYKTLSGFVENKSIDLEHSIDWHLPIFVSQSYTENVETPKVVVEKTTFEQIASIEYVTLYASGKELKVVTTDKMLRNFLMVQPHRIVLDFDRDTTLKMYIKENPKQIFNKIRVGNHNKYYRIVIELDGLYTYKMQTIADGYLFKLR